jgi:uncharacterized membrane protein
MAGIGLELRRMMRKETLGGMAQTYTYAGLIGSGPWVISIIAILLIGLLATATPAQSLVVEQFQVSISYLMAGSLLLTGPLQLVFTRFAADRIYEDRTVAILPNLIGALCVTVLVSTLVGGAVLQLWFEGPFVYRLCMLASFVILCCIWILQVFASAIDAPCTVVLLFASGYALTVGAALALREYGLEGLLSGFVAGQAFLLFAFLAMIVRQFPAERLIAFSFMRRKLIFPELALIGLFYNLGVWADKIIFWGDALTGEPVVGPLRASPIYDFPIFLAYLSIIPGMAVFFVRMEADVADQCARFYRVVTSGGSYAAIAEAKQELAAAMRRCLLDITGVQAVTTLLLLMFGGELLNLFGMSPLYRPLLSVDLVAVAMQLMLLAILSFFFYLDRRKIALSLCVLFFLANTVFSLMSIHAGPSFYGYGFAAAVLLTAVTGAFQLSSTVDRLEYETFMLQPVKF